MGYLNHSKSDRSRRENNWSPALSFIKPPPDPWDAVLSNNHTFMLHGFTIQKGNSNTKSPILGEALVLASLKYSGTEHYAQNEKIYIDAHENRL